MECPAVLRLCPRIIVFRPFVKQLPKLDVAGSIPVSRSGECDEYVAGGEAAERSVAFPRSATGPAFSELFSNWSIAVSAVVAQAAAY